MKPRALTDRQLQLLRLHRDGRTVDQIAKEMTLNPSTVRQKLAAIARVSRTRGYTNAGDIKVRSLFDVAEGTQ